MEYKTITITAVETKQTAMGKTVIKIKDQENLTYSLWPNKVDGTASVAGLFYKTLPNNGIGSQVEVGYTQEEKEYKGRQITFRTIGVMKLAGEQPVNSAVVARKGIAQDKQTNEDAKWEKIRAEKNDNIKWMNALNNACLLMNRKDWNWNKLVKLANDIYRLEPEKNLKEKLETAEWANQEPPQPPDLAPEEIQIDDIPFN